MGAARSKQAALVLKEVKVEEAEIVTPLIAIAQKELEMIKNGESTMFWHPYSASLQKFFKKIPYQDQELTLSRRGKGPLVAN